MRVLIVDDEPVARLGIRRALADQAGIEIAGECGTAKSALQSIRELDPDLIFLDVQLPGFDGFEVLDRLGTVGRKPAVIFTTAFDQYALDAFAVQAVDYLLKPWSKDRLLKALDRARTLLSVHAVSEPDQIDWIEAAGNYVCLHSGNKRQLLRSTIEKMDSRLSRHPFLRIHRSRIVNLLRVQKLRRLRHGEFEMTLASGNVVLSSRSYAPAIQAALDSGPLNTFRSQLSRFLPEEQP